MATSARGDLADTTSAEIAQPVVARVRDGQIERGLLVLGAGPNSLRLSPPLCITDEQADWAMQTLESCLATL